jgi:hypothetical protein
VAGPPHLMAPMPGASASLQKVSKNGCCLRPSRVLMAGRAQALADWQLAAPTSAAARASAHRAPRGPEGRTFACAASRHLDTSCMHKGDLPVARCPVLCPLCVLCCTCRWHQPRPSL